MPPSNDALLSASVRAAFTLPTEGGRPSWTDATDPNAVDSVDRGGYVSLWRACAEDDPPEVQAAALLQIARAGYGVALPAGARLRLDLGSATEPVSVPQFRIQGDNAQVETAGWYIRLTSDSDGARNVDIRDTRLSGGPQARGAGNLLTLYDSAAPRVSGCVFSEAQRDLVLIHKGVGQPYVAENTFRLSGLERHRGPTGVPYGNGVLISDRPTGKIVNNTFEDIWQVAVFVISRGVEMAGGLILGNRVDRCEDNGIRTQPPSIEQAALIRDHVFAHNTVRGARIDAICSNGVGHTVIGNHIDQADDRRTNYGVRIDYGADQVWAMNRVVGCSAGFGVRLALPGAFARNMQFCANQVVEAAGFAAISHSVLTADAHFEDIRHFGDTAWGAMRGLSVSGTPNAPERCRTITLHGVSARGASQHGASFSGIEGLTIIGGDYTAAGGITLWISRVRGATIQPGVVRSERGGGVVLRAGCAHVRVAPVQANTGGPATADASGEDSNTFSDSAVWR